MIIKTRGIVLAKIRLSFQDSMLTLLTSELGLVSAVVKGAGSKKNRSSASTEVLACGEFCLFRGKTRYIVDSADLEDNFFELRSDLTALSLAAYFCELCRFILPSEDNGGTCLKLLLNTLYLLEKGKRTPAFLKAVFELRLLTLCGFAPDVSGCSLCGSDEPQNYLFLPGEGQIICGSCAGKISGQTYSLPMPYAVQRAFSHVIESEDRTVFSFRLSPEGEEAFAAAAESFVLFHTENTFKSLDYYKKISNPDPVQFTQKGSPT